MFTYAPAPASTPTSPPAPRPIIFKDPSPQQSNDLSASSKSLLAASSTPWGVMLKNHFNRQSSSDKDVATSLVRDLGLKYIGLVEENIISLSLANQRKDVQIEHLEWEACMRETRIENLKTTVECREDKNKDLSNMIENLRKIITTKETEVKDLNNEMAKSKQKVEELEEEKRAQKELPKSEPMQRQKVDQVPKQQTPKKEDGRNV